MRTLQGYTRVSPGIQHQQLTSYRLPFITPDAFSVRRVALAAGMRDAGNGFFVAEDGSWVALIDGEVERGAGKEVFTRLQDEPSYHPPRRNTPPGVEPEPTIDSTAVTRAIRECRGDRASLHHWLLTTPGVITVGGVERLRRAGVSVPASRRARL